MKVVLASDIETDSIVDGEGLRTIIWMQGCFHNCLGCHNPETHDPNGGHSVDIEEILNVLDKVENQDGITLSGGDPLFQPEASLLIAKHAHSLGLNVWAYTGYTYEQLIKLSETKPIYYELLKNIDVLVDGKFEIGLKSLNCIYRGSKNQRILDVKESLKRKKAIIKSEYDPNMTKQKKEKSCIFI